MKCVVCGSNSESEYCFRHKPRKKKVSTVNKDHLLFKEIWNKRPHRSEVSGRPLGKEPLSVFFHHILPKNKYPEFRLDEENIILLTIDEHANVEADMYRYEKINTIRDCLMKKYNMS